MACVKANTVVTYCIKYLFSRITAPSVKHSVKKCAGHTKQTGDFIYIAAETDSSAEVS